MEDAGPIFNVPGGPLSAILLVDRGKEDPVGKTDRYFKRSVHPEGSGSPQGSAQPREFQVRVGCKGRAAAQVLEDLARGLAEAGAKDLDPLLVLEDLGLLADSVTMLIKGLCRLLVGYPRTVTFWESSGFTEAFMSVMDAQASPGEKPPPPLDRT